MDKEPRYYPRGHGGRKVNNNKQPDTWHNISSTKFDPVFSSSMPDDYQGMLTDLMRLWHAKIARNTLRKRYYDGKNVLKDFGISIPPQLLSVETVVGWPQKAVDSMAVRCRFDGFTATDYTAQTLLDNIVSRSHLRVKSRQAIQSALIHSCCFASVTVDDDGLPVIDLDSAETAAARWDAERGRIAYGMTIESFEHGKPSRVRLFADDAVIDAWDTGYGYWDWAGEHVSMGRPAMEVIAYKPTFERPFGRSRITRAVMSLTDSAVRVALGGDVSYQFSVAPQKYLLGADEDIFDTRTKWEAYIGNIFAISRDEFNDSLPQFGQLSQGSMQQTSDYFRLLAARFSGETNVPISNLGVIHDQPASAEAIYAASEPLIIDCEDFNDGIRDALYNVAVMALAARLDAPIDALPADLLDFTASMRNPAMPSIVSQTDAMVKLASVVPGFAGTDTFFEQVGFSEDMRRKARAEIDEAQGIANISAVLNG